MASEGGSRFHVKLTKSSRNVPEKVERKASVGGAVEPAAGAVRAYRWVTAGLPLGTAGWWGGGVVDDINR